LDGVTYLGVASSGPNAGTKIFVWNGTSFEEFQTLGTIDARDIEAFDIDGNTFLAVANYFNGSSYNIDSDVFRWNGTGFEMFQRLPTHGARAVKMFEFGDNFGLVFANNYNGTSYNIDSAIFTWTGTEFTYFQGLATNGAVDVTAFIISDVSYIALPITKTVRLTTSAPRSSFSTAQILHSTNNSLQRVLWMSLTSR
jgi:hypothetical protein